VYRWGSELIVLLVGVYVDDLIITGADQEEVECFKAAMKEQLDMSDLGFLCFYLGIEVRQDAKGITLCQAHYAKRILELGEMAGCNPATTPMGESRAEEVDRSLRYLVHTRSDLVFTVGYLSRFMERSTMEHQQAIKRVLRYVAGTLDYGLHYKRAPGTARFIGYCDSDLAGDIDICKSTSGTMFYLGDCLVS
jgi:hypothetical protein